MARKGLFYTWSPTGRKLYLNGVCEAENSRNVPIALSESSRIGFWGGNYLNGVVDDFRISTRARTEEEILSGYLNQKPLPNDESTVYKLNMDQGLQTESQGRNNLKIHVPVDTTIADYGLKSKQISVSSGGAYTLSASLKGLQIKDGKGAFLRVQFFNAEDQLIGQVDAQPFIGDFDWRKQILTFTTPIGTVKAKVFVMVNGHGTAWFDAVQLESGYTASRYNLVENANVEQGTTSPDKWYGTAVSGTATYTLVQDEHKSGNKSLKLSSSTGADASWKQDINVKPSTTYTFTGWVRTEDLEKIDAEVYGTFYIGKRQTLPTFAAI